MSTKPASPQSPIAGRIVRKTFGYDGGREVAVYLPPIPAEAVIYCADGQVLSQWGAALEAAATPPIAIVGIFRTAAADEMVRLAEYSPSFDPERFAAHENFVINDVRSWATDTLDLAFSPSHTAVGGVSAGAEFALAMGLRHPEIFGAVYAASPGAGFAPPADMPRPLPRVYLTAGTGEPFFRDKARRWAEALRDADADVVITEPEGEHGGTFWQSQFVSMIGWAFGRA